MRKFLLMFLLFATTIKSQEVIDQVSLGASPGYQALDSGIVLKQTFVAGYTGALSRIDVDVLVYNCNSGISPFWYTCYVYDSAGTVLANQTVGINAPYTRALHTIGFVNPANVISGHQYYFSLFTNSQLCDTATNSRFQLMWFTSVDDAGYSSGTAYNNNSPLYNDMYFQTFVDTTANNPCQNPISVNAFVVTPETGCAGNNAELAATPSGGTAPYTYSWAPSGGTGSSTGPTVSQGMYTVTVTDANGCTGVGNVFSYGNTLTLNASANPISCYNGGTINSYASGGDGTLTYLWSNAATTADLTGLTTPGQYYVTVSDTAGCVKSDTVILTDSRMNITFDLFPSTCGNNNAYIYSYANGGASPTFSWSGPSGFTSSNQFIFNLIPGVYTLTVTDTLCPTDVDSIVVAPSAPITITHVINNHVSCNGAYDGSATISITGAGSSPNIWWGSGSSGLSDNDLGAGYTYVQVMDSSGYCVGYDSILITEPAVLMDSLSFTEPSCGLNNGNISTHVTGGTAPYSYFWNTGNMSNNLNGITAGIYMVDVTDANGCMVTSRQAIGSAGGPVITEDVHSDITCNGLDNGSIAVSISGGTAPYTIYWTDMDSSYTVLTRNNLQVGPYELVVEDAGGCQTIFSTYINEPYPLYIDLNSTSPSACLTSDGSVSSNVYGGTAPYTYFWSDATTSTSISGVSAGVYSLTITDSNGCTLTSETFVSDPTSVDAYGNDIPTNCGTNTGAIDITAFGGSGSYSYQWTNGATTEDISGLYPGSYGVIITDLFDGCVKTLQFGVNSTTANYQPEVCLVTVDTLDEKNVIVWERPVIGGIKEFVIYRETSQPGTYRYIGTNPIDSLTQMKDTLANTDLHTWKYKISAIDSCGVETGVSEIEHRPIFLTVDTNNVGLPSLVWTHYMGRPYSDYIVKRNANNTGWVDVVTLPATQSSFVDLNCPSGMIEYTIEAVFTSTCEATRGAINTTRSNIKSPTSFITGVKGLVKNENVGLYPNPANDKFTLTFGSELKADVSVEVVNSLGQVVYSINSGLSKSVLIDVSEWNNGVYFVRVNSTELHSVIKFVKQ